MINIYIATHKNSVFPQVDGYSPILVGASNNPLNICKDRDCTGINISDKNSSYCELTALYWVWKNKSLGNYGLCHYRRYFYSDNNINNIKFKEVAVVSPAYIDSELTKNKKKVFLPKPLSLWKKKVFPLNIKQHYINNHDEKEWVILKRIVSDLYPEYSLAFSEVEKKRKMSCFNMMIADYEVLSCYCKWLFDILFELEKRVSLEDKNKYQSRMFGFISERLLNVFFEYNSNVYDVEYLNTIMVE